MRAAAGRRAAAIDFARVGHARAREQSSNQLSSRGVNILLRKSAFCAGCVSHFAGRKIVQHSIARRAVQSERVHALLDRALGRSFRTVKNLLGKNLSSPTSRLFMRKPFEFEVFAGTADATQSAVY